MFHLTTHLGVEDLGVGPGGRPLARLADQPHPLAGVGLVPDLTQDDGRSREGVPARGPPGFGHRPDETRLHRRRRLVNVVAVQAEASFKPQRVSGSQACQPDL